MPKTIKKSRNKHLPANGNHFLDKPVYSGDNIIPTSIKLIQYNTSSSSETDISNAILLKDKIDDNKINWFKITGISDTSNIEKICREFNLHIFDVKDLLSNQKVVKVVPYDNVTFILMSAFSLDNDSLLDEDQIAFIMGKNFIISFQESDLAIFDEVEKAIAEDGSMIRGKYTDFLLYLLLNAVNSTNSSVAMRIEDELVDIEDLLIERRNTGDILHLLRMRRIDYTRMHRFVLAFREEYNNLLHNINGLIGSKDMIYFNDYDDRLRTTLGNLEGFREALFSLLDLYYNNNNLILNNIMKRLTIVSTIFIPLTFLVGVWGMNFEFMPEIHFKYGYLFAWIALISLGVSTWLYMRNKKWF